ncbi:MAG TPA: ABC transporter permease [Acidimicrobiales bacterium]|nr:ABC transporter permease [Acidimicrobiales bacterium]
MERDVSLAPGAGPGAAPDLAVVPPPGDIGPAPLGPGDEPFDNRAFAVTARSVPGVAEKWASLVRWEAGLALALVGTVVVGALLSGQFLTSSNLLNAGLSNGEVAIMALPMMMVIIAGEIDLSIQSTLSLASCMLGYLWGHGWPMPLAIATVLATGVVLGIFNGLLVTRLGLPSLAVTIGTLALYGGIAEIVLGSNIISTFPESYANIGVYPFPHTPVSYSTVIFAGLALVFCFVLHFTAFGRSVFAIGANKEAALYAGIRVKRVKTVLFAVSGLIGALAGVLLTFELSTAEFSNGNGLVLPVVAVVLLGGVSIFGGKGSLLGVVLAILVFAGLQNALLLTNFPQTASEIIPGALLMVAVLVPYAGELLRRGRSFLRREQVPGSSGGGRR